MACERLVVALVCAYAAALVFAVHLALSTLAPTELATPPLCMHAPFAGVARAFMLGPPARASRFAACALNASIEVVPVPAANLSALSLANLYHITAPKHPIFRDIELSSLEQAGQFAAWLAALRALRYNQRALVLEATAVVAPDPRWVVLHAALSGLRRFDVVRLEPCGGEITRVPLERGLVLQRCVHRCFNPWAAASAVVSYAGARKMLRHADRDHQVVRCLFLFACRALTRSPPRPTTSGGSRGSSTSRSPPRSRCTASRGWALTGRAGAAGSRATRPSSS
jgi:hypothetical protein